MSRLHQVFCRNLRGNAVIPRVPPSRSTVRLQPTQTSCAITRCYSSNDQKEPSWSDLAKGAAYLVGDAVHKVGTAVSNVVSGILPGRRREEEIKGRGPSPADLGKQLLGPGLFGRLMGGVISSAISSAARQMEKAAEVAANLQDQTARIVENSAEVQRQVGGRVTILPPISQFSGMSNINGFVRKSLTLVMPIANERGQIVGQTTVKQVQGSSSDGKEPPFDITVELNDGRTIELDSSAPSGQTIDVEWRKVD